jgi:sugar phosphate permease
MVLRFIMGAAEAGYGPGIPYLLSFFYLRHEVGLRMGIFLSAAPLANTFAGALAYGITSGTNLAIANWRLLFLVEGLPTICMAAVAFFFLPDSPSTARFLTEDEKRAATARARRQVGDSGGSRIGGFSFAEFGRALLDAKAWLTALMYFSCNVSFASLPVFLPTILEEMGFEAVDAQGLTAPPFFVSFAATILTTLVADRTQQRGAMIIALSLVGGIGYVVLATVPGTGPRYFAVFLAAAGVFPSIANILPWVANNQGSDTRRGAAFVLLNWVGQCGPLLGTRIFPDEQAPQYVKGQSICAAFMFFNAFLALALRTLLVWENKRLAQKEAADVDPAFKPDREAERERLEGIENYGKGFRYVL